tara:strand:- start:102 stop:311 length:210 start_codon:yes stop_codon:yes gene_type:complete
MFKVISYSMLDIKTKKNDLGLWEAEATLNLPEVKVTLMKADKDNLKYELQRAFSEIVNEYVEKHAKDEM